MRALLLDRNTGTHLRKKDFFQKNLTCFNRNTGTHPYIQICPKWGHYFWRGTQEHTWESNFFTNKGTLFWQEKDRFSENWSTFNRNTPLKTDVLSNQGTPFVEEQRNRPQKLNSLVCSWYIKLNSFEKNLFSEVCSCVPVQKECPHLGHICI